MSSRARSKDCSYRTRIALALRRFSSAWDCKASRKNWHQPVQSPTRETARSRS
jgi:hypothetical protein